MYRPYRIIGWAALLAGISERLGLSGKTVANYVSVILAKIDATDRNDAARKVIAAR